MKVGGGGREGRKRCFLPFFPTPSQLFYWRHFSRGSKTLIPCSLLLNRTETLAAQANTFDENSLCMALIFPIVSGYWHADFAFFFFLPLYVYLKLLLDWQQQQATVKRTLPLTMGKLFSSN